MNYINYIKKRLQGLKESDIIFTKHVKERFPARETTKTEIINNLLNPNKLVIALKQKSTNPLEERFDCYFRYEERHHHRYIIALNGRCIIITIMVRHRSLDYLKRYIK